MKKIKIFISSPGDVALEREKAREVIKRLQKRYRKHFELISMLWEDLPLGADMSFQEGIDWIVSKDDGVDIAIFILWSRLGTPLGGKVQKQDGNHYLSGTEREFDLMLRARESSISGGGPDRPVLLVYVREDEESFHINQRGKSTSDLKNMVEQKELVEKFIQENFYDAESGTNIRAFHNFDVPTTFSHRLRIHLQNSLDELLKDAELHDQGWDTTAKGAPYRGLEVFDVEHEEIFFGRDQEISDVLVALERQALKGKAFVLLVGASGSGKSSLARAGIIPALQHFETDPVFYRYGIMRPGQYLPDLFLGLAQVFSSETALPESITSEQSTKDLADSLRNNPEIAYKLALKPILQKLDETTKGETRLLLLIDQMEELFTGKTVSSDDVSRFINALDSLSATGRIRILATMRSDFYASLLDYPKLVKLKEGDGQYDLLPPKQSHIQRLITEPAWLAGIQFEENQKTGERLSQSILNDALQHPDALPLLQYTLRELYENRTQDGILTFNMYESLGGVEGAIGKRAEETYRDLAKDVRQLVPRLFRSLITINKEQEYTSKSVVLDTYLNLSADKNKKMKTAVEAFIQSRLLISHKNEDSQVVIRLSHEALIRSWPRLNQWLVDARELIQIRSRVDQSLTHWLEKARSDDLLLYEGMALEEAKALQKKWPEELTDNQLEYITCSDKYHRRKRLKKLRFFQMISLLFLVLTVTSLTSLYKAYQSAVREQTARNDAEDLVKFMLFDLHEKLETVGRTDILLSTTQGVEAYFNNHPPAVDDPKAIHRYCIMRFQMGGVLLEMGKRDAALQYYAESQDLIRESLKANPENTVLNNILAISLDNLGDVYRLAGEWEKALQYYRDSLELRRKFVEMNPENLEWLHDLSASMQFVGDTLFEVGDRENALLHYHEGLSLREKLLETDPENCVWMGDVAVSLNSVGDALVKEKKYQEALDFYRRSLGLMKKLSGIDPSNPHWQYELSIGLDNIGDMLSAIGKQQEALQNYLESRKIRQNLVTTDAENTMWQNSLAASYQFIGNAYRKAGQMEEALHYYKQCMGLNRTFIASDPENTKHLTGFTIALSSIGQVLLFKEKKEEALAVFNESLDIIRRLVANDPANGFWLRELSVALNNVGDVYLAEKKQEDALLYYREGLGVIQELMTRDRNNSAWKTDLAISFSKIGDGYWLSKDVRSALKNYTEAITILKDLALNEMLSTVEKDQIGEIEEKIDACTITTKEL